MYLTVEPLMLSVVAVGTWISQFHVTVLMWLGVVMVLTQAVTHCCMVLSGNESHGYLSFMLLYWCCDGVDTSCNPLLYGTVRWWRCCWRARRFQTLSCWRCVSTWPSTSARRRSSVRETGSRCSWSDASSSTTHCSWRWWETSPSTTDPPRPCLW